MNKALVGGILAVVIVVGAVLLLNNNATAPTTENNNEVVTPNPTPTPVTPNTEPDPSPTTPNPTSPSPNPTGPQTHTVSMTDSGYSPSTLTVKKGDTVNFVNNGTKANWPASAPHPTHTDYPAFDPKRGIAVGETWAFKFDRVGTWRYHDHNNSSRFATIVVTE